MSEEELEVISAAKAWNAVSYGEVEPSDQELDYVNERLGNAVDALIAKEQS